MIIKVLSKKLQIEPDKDFVEIIAGKFKVRVKKGDKNGIFMERFGKKVNFEVF